MFIDVWAKGREIIKGREILGFPGGSDSKESACRRHEFNPWVGKIPWRREWQLTVVVLSG